MFSFSALLAVAGATELQYDGEDLEKSTSWKASSLEFSDSLWPKEATYYIVIVHILAFLPAWLCSDKHTHCLYTPCYFHSLFLVRVSENLDVYQSMFSVYMCALSLVKHLPTLQYNVLITVTPPSPLPACLLWHFETWLFALRRQF